MGGGGHSRLILQAADNTKVMAVDQDLDALTAAKTRLSEFGDRVDFLHTNFVNFPFSPNTYDGILADLGVSSYHLDNPERGFSFRHTANLDMRMNQQQSLTAADIVNGWDEQQLTHIFFQYGEERLSRKIARRIIENRPFSTTTQLAESISSCVPPKYRYGRIQLQLQLQLQQHDNMTSTRTTTRTKTTTNNKNNNYNYNYNNMTI